MQKRVKIPKNPKKPTFLKIRKNSPKSLKIQKMTQNFENFKKRAKISTNLKKKRSKIPTKIAKIPENPK